MIKKQLVLFLSVIVLLCMTALSASAADGLRLIDGAGLLSDDEETAVLASLDEISERQQLDIVIVTTNSTDGRGVQAYADDYFDYNGYGFGADRDGILLLIDMGERMWAMSTSGYGMTAFNDAGLAYLENCFLSDLSAGNYDDAFLSYAGQCDALITLAREGEPYGSGYNDGYDYDYDYDYDYEEFSSFDAGSTLMVSLFVGGIVSLVIVLSMCAQLKSVRQQNAGAYQRAGSLQITESREMFLYRNVTKTVRQDNDSSGGGSRSGGSRSSSHRSSSGRSHGGRSGRF